MDSDNKIEVAVKETTIQNGYVVLCVEKFGCNIQSEKNSAWITVGIPENKELKLAYPLPHAAGTMPEGTVDLTTVSDMIKNLAEELLLGMTKSKEAW